MAILKDRFYRVEFILKEPKRDCEEVSASHCVKAKSDIDVIAIIEKLAKTNKYSACEVSKVCIIDKEEFKEFFENGFRVSYTMKKKQDGSEIDSVKVVEATDCFKAIEKARKDAASAGYKFFYPTEVEPVDDDEDDD